MRISSLRIIALVVLQLALIETGLEYRANLRGWWTILFGAGKIERKVTEASKGEHYGPGPEFPFRSKIVAATKKEGVDRYWIASSSMGLHASLPPQEIFPNRFQRDMEKKGREIDVINASRVGWRIDQNMVEMRDLGSRWLPDVVILYNMTTDINTICKKLLGSDNFSEDGNKDQGKVAGVRETKKWTSRLWERTTIYSHLQTILTSRIARCRILVNSLGDKGLHEFERSIREFIRTCREVGARPVLCTFATSHGRRQLPDWPVELKNWLFRWNIYLSIEGWVDTIEKFNTVLISVGREEKVRVVDISAVMTGKQEYFIDFVHFSGKGHEMVAELLTEALA